MLRGFFDESGIHDGSRVCIIAGYVGSVNEWDRFERFWGHHAGAAGFHAKRFWGRDNGRRVRPYEGWSDADADRYLTTLLDAITSVKLLPIGGMVDVQDFFGYTEDERRVLTGGYQVGGRWKLSGAPSRPYHLIFQQIVFCALRAAERPGWKVDFTFDAQNEFAPLARKMYADISSLDHEFRPLMGKMEFRSRADAIALQAADLLAHCWYQYGLKGETAPPDIHRVLGVQRHDTVAYFNKDTMDKVLGRAPLTPAKVYSPSGVAPAKGNLKGETFHDLFFRRAPARRSGRKAG